MKVNVYLVIFFKNSTLTVNASSFALLEVLFVLVQGSLSCAPFHHELYAMRFVFFSVRVTAFHLKGHRTPIFVCDG